MIVLGQVLGEGDQRRKGGVDVYEPITSMMFPCEEAMAQGQALGSSELAWGRFTRLGGAANEQSDVLDHEYGGRRYTDGR